MSAAVTFHSDKDLTELRAALEAACQAHGFGVIGAHDLRAKLESKGVPLDFDCQVVDVCNPKQAKRVLDANRLVSTVLPCRIALYQDPAGGSLAGMVPPTALIGMFDAPDLRAVAEEVESTLTAILRDAVG